MWLILKQYFTYCTQNNLTRKGNLVVVSNNDKPLRHKFMLIFKGVVSWQNSRDKGPPEGNSARG